MVDLDLTLKYVSLYNNLISLICGITLFLIVLYTILYNYEGSDKLSYRFYLWIAINDVSYNLLIFIKQYIVLFYNLDTNVDEALSEIIYSYGNPQYCNFNIHVEHVLNLWYVFLIACLGINLHASFLKNKAIKLYTDLQYAMTTILLSVLLNLPSFIVGIVYNKCSGLTNLYFGTYSYLHFFLTFFLPNIFAIGYITFIFLLSFKKLINNKLGSISPTSYSNQFNRLSKRFLGYAIIPLITQLPYLICSISLYISFKYTIIHFFFMDILGSCNGWLNLLFFLLDPLVPKLYVQLKHRYYNGLLFNSKLTDNGLNHDNTRYFMFNLNFMRPKNKANKYTLI
ncbi:hypothetical protein K502DRAFT_349923 [Neoconidiobolus thromboides FSU 785]|nr:hypothetical protein K502DRAFT_349923 [Neoconidiobolus thromboides FSU 785]